MRLASLLLAAALLASCAALGRRAAPTAAPEAPPSALAPPVLPGDTALAVTLLETTDFHGALLTGGTERSTNQPWGGAAVLGAWQRMLTARAPGVTFLLDGGDMMQGTPISNLVFGRSVIEVMNVQGYDAAALGNHDFDWGVDTLRARMAQARFPVLACNVFDKATGARPAWLEPYRLVRRGRVTVAVVGVATPETPLVTAPSNVATLRFDDPAPIVNALVPELRARGADVVVVLAHMGGQVERNGDAVGRVFDLARLVRGVDAVFGGHTHSFVATQVAGRPVVVSASNGRVIGEVDVVVNRVARSVRPTGEWLHRTYADSVTVPAGDPVAAIVAHYDSLVGPLMQRVLGRAAAPVTRGSQAMANLVTDAMRQAVGADVAFTNAGGLRRDFEAGPISLGEVYELMPFENELVTMELTGAQVKQVIEERPSRICVSGVRGRYDPVRPEGDRITDLTRDDGKPLDPAGLYTVVANDFIAQGGDGFGTFAAGRDRRDTGRLLRDAIVSAIESLQAAGRAVVPDTTERLVGRPGRGGR
jgi:2',3'-cyclic-nucleotide 2'-phosphodiesterase/3'-nucleotidase